MLKNRSIRAVAPYLLSVLAASLTVCSSCSFVVDTGKTQCTTTADCLARGPAFQDLTCGIDGVCSKQSGCNTASDCIAANNGDPFICNHATRTCVALKNKYCQPQAEPSDIGNENTIWVGMTFTSLPSMYDLSRRSQNSAELARREIAKLGNGLPPTSPNKPRRPLAIEYCDGVDDPDKTNGFIADFFIKQMGVPAILGWKDSGTAQKEMPAIVAADVIVFAPQNSSPLLETVDRGNPVHFIRTADDTGTQMKVLAGNIVSGLWEPSVRKALSLQPSDPIRIALLEAGSPFGLAVADATFSTLTFNGQSPAANGANFLRLNYGDPTDPAHTDAQYLAAATQTAAFKPHIVIFNSTAESIKLVTNIEKDWTETTFRPIYAGNTGAMPSAGYATLVGTNTDLRHRVFSVTGSSNYPPNSDGFISRYNSEPGLDYPVSTATTGNNSYDAFYLLAYAITAAGSNPINGSSISTGLLSLLPGPGRQKIAAGPSYLDTAYRALQGGGAFDFDGVGGPQDIDPKTGDVRTNQDVLCMGADTSGKATGLVTSGLQYDVTANVLTGTFNCP